MALDELRRAVATDETARLKEQLDAGGPMSRAWEYYVALAGGTDKALSPES